MKCTSKVEWTLFPSGRVELRFRNIVTGEERYQIYKNTTAAKCAETKFYNRMNRIYGHLLNS